MDEKLQSFVNVPWYFSLLYSMFSPFLTQRTKSKFVISKEGNVAETLYKYIRAEDVPVQYGGLSRPSDVGSGPVKPSASEFTVKGGEKVNIQIEGIEGGSTITWDIVFGNYTAQSSYQMLKIKAATPLVRTAADWSQREAIHNSLRPRSENLLSVDNTDSRKRKVAAYR
ncbi:UNVERIFIED_CONTAM: Patellin-6 [Sesamum latifolium]|uniref:Patellin-6 n=1 Tax=Sesamum latifolium TaxID=2727402 RepID=A0AAW2VAX7_9LAMI